MAIKRRDIEPHLNGPWLFSSLVDLRPGTMRSFAVARLLLLPFCVHGFKGLLKGTTPDQCETVLDDVWEEKCETLIKDNCYVKPVTQCDTVAEKDCYTVPEEKCAWTMESKCLSHPVPFCKLEWEKVCVPVPQCTTRSERECRHVEKQQCEDVVRKECAVEVKKICAEFPVEPWQGDLPSPPDVRPVESHALHKRSLELLLNKLDFKAKKLELKKEMLVRHFALKGQLKGGAESHDKGHAHVKAHPKDIVVTPHQKFETICHDEPTEVCRDVPDKSCHSALVEECLDVPKQDCIDVDKCIDVPKKNCGVKEKETCLPLPARKCATVDKVVCKDVPRQVCRDVPHEYCDPVPGKDCQKILVQRPRQVCKPDVNKPAHLY